MAKKKARRKKVKRAKAGRRTGKRKGRAAAAKRAIGKRKARVRDYRMVTGRRMGRLGLLRQLRTATGRARAIRRAITYWETERVESSWLTHIHLVEVGVTAAERDRPRLAITYRSGVTCYYVDTTEADYRRMQAGISKGKMVHRWYYNFAYIVI